LPPGAPAIATAIVTLAAIVSSPANAASSRLELLGVFQDESLTFCIDLVACFVHGGLGNPLCLLIATSLLGSSRDQYASPDSIGYASSE